MREKILDEFTKDTKDHTMRILNDNGVYRHLKFIKSASSVYWFDLITWPGCLAINGDMGSYVFERNQDMFEFFYDSGEELVINPGYWGEKLISIDEIIGYRQFSFQKFSKCVMSDFESWEFENDIKKQSALKDVECQVLIDDDDPYASYQRISNFESEYGHTFIDFWEHDCKEYNSHYVWCLYAIVYGIREYRKAKKDEG